MDGIIFCLYVLVGLILSEMCMKMSSRVLTNIEELSIAFFMSLFWPIALLGFAIVTLAVLFREK